MTRIQTQRLAVMPDCFRSVALHEKNIREVIVCLCIVGLESQRLDVRIGGLGHFVEVTHAEYDRIPSPDFPPHVSQRLNRTLLRQERRDR